MPLAHWLTEACLFVCARVHRLQKSILNDYVKKEERGFWNALESITRVGWSGSAMVGGVIVNRFGFGWSFGLTAGMQFLAWCIRCTLLPLVPRREADAAAGGSSGDGSDGSDPDPFKVGAVGGLGGRPSGRDSATSQLSFAVSEDDLERVPALLREVGVAGGAEASGRGEYVVLSPGDDRPGPANAAGGGGGW